MSMLTLLKRKWRMYCQRGPMPYIAVFTLLVICTLYLMYYNKPRVESFYENYKEPVKANALRIQEAMPGVFDKIDKMKKMGNPENWKMADLHKPFNETLNFLNDKLKSMNMTNAFMNNIAFPNLIDLRKNMQKPKPTLLNEWRNKVKRKQMCDRALTLYNNEFALLNDVIIDRNFSKGAIGGESLHEVLNQLETDEIYQLKQGFFKMDCEADTLSDYTFSGDTNHLNAWLEAVSTKSSTQGKDINKIPELTIAIQRYEYANFYHVITDIYNAFLMMTFFDKQPENTNIIFIDGHPFCELDLIWQKLFHSVQRVGHLEGPTLYESLVWGMVGYNSPLNSHGAGGMETLPLAKEFKEFYLGGYGIPSGGPLEHKLNCDKINILFIWRRDYVSHPRNPGGKIDRKILNEDELLQAMRTIDTVHKVEGIQFDQRSMGIQLNYITNADLLIGMHGAGLSHTLFLPPHSALLELSPNDWSPSNKHFWYFAKWSGVSHYRWQSDMRGSARGSRDPAYTIVPPGTLKDLVTKIIANMCKTDQSSQ
ncbi:unnamed protein product [Owenia fusiformis]|uniref:EGF domain-specific O-linked N-acetylglucosamine transferase n=1 Tax=Owenia fusiformis TaxID=6347 RepID=A0A8J1TA35_OWEFU|nr:unnamed protein product [Owenia fusiformis]